MGCAVSFTRPVENNYLPLGGWDERIYGVTKNLLKSTGDSSYSSPLLNHPIAQRLLKPAHHLLRHHLPEVIAHQRPVVEQAPGEAALGLLDMLANQALQLGLPEVRVQPLPD